MQELIKSKLIEGKDAEEILSLTEGDISLSLMKDYFANTSKHSQRFSPYDIINVPANKYFNLKPFQTTVGRIIHNLLLGYDIMKLIGFQNYQLDGDGIGKLDSKIVSLLLEKQIDGERYAKYLDSMNFYYGIVKFLGPSLTLDLIKPTPKAQALKEELLTKNEKAIRNNDIRVMSDIEKQVMNQAVEEVDNLPDFDIYKSGATGKINNSFKNTTYFRGAIRGIGEEDGQYYISTKSLLEGIPPEEMYKYSNILVQASYGRAISTRQGGYQYKQLASALQNIVLDEPGSDCGTKQTKRLKVTKDVAKLLKYRYIVENGKLKLLTPDNISEYIGKEVNLRSPMYCKGEKYCSKCSGELYYRMGDLRNVGLITNRIGTALLNSALKLLGHLVLVYIKTNNSEKLR